MGQRFFASESHGQRQPTALGSSLLEIEDTKSLSKMIKRKPRSLSEQMPALTEGVAAATVAPEVIDDQQVVATDAGNGLQKNTGFLERIQDMDCCQEGIKASETQLAKIDLALDQTCATLERDCLESLWKEVVSITNVELMKNAVERFMVRYSSVDPAFVVQKATELSEKDPYYLDAYAFSNALSIFYNQNGQEATEHFFNFQKNWGARAAEFAKLFLSNEIMQAQELQANLIQDLATPALTNELAQRMRRKVFSDWYDRDPETASGFVESQGQDGNLLEILNMKKQISSLRLRMNSRSPASENDPALVSELQAQINHVESELAKKLSF